MKPVTNTTEHNSPLAGETRAKKSDGAKIRPSFARKGRTANCNKHYRMQDNSPFSPLGKFEEVEFSTANLLVRVLGGGSVQSQHDAHVSAWCDFIERSSIIEFDGERPRAEAEKVALRLIKTDLRKPPNP